MKQQTVYYVGLESSDVVNTNGSVVPSPTMVLPSATASQPTNSPGSLEVFCVLFTTVPPWQVLLSPLGLPAGTQ